MISVLATWFTAAFNSSSTPQERKKLYDKTVLLLLGAPGVGKGTYGKKLSQDWKMPVFSTGDYLRSLVKDPNSALGKKVKSIMDSGALVDDKTMMEVIDQRLFVDEAATAKGIILDGFPRTVNQADLLGQRCKISAVVNFVLSDDVLREKLEGRRECVKCHAAYNVADVRRGDYDMPPLLPKKDPVKCDDCGGHLILRDDDKPAVIGQRLKVYYEKTAPLEEYYRKKGLLFAYEPKKGIKEYPEIKRRIEEFMAQLKNRVPPTV